MVRRTTQDAVQYRFLPQIPVDVDHTLEQLLRSFQPVKEGLPELLKNAKDHYSRLGVLAKADRQIIIIADARRRALGVLDFAGADKDDFSKWVTWSDATASRSDTGSDIEGGHGNGGKAFMVWGAVTGATIESVAAGRRTMMGYKNDEQRRRHLPAFIVESGTPINDVVVRDVRRHLNASLGPFGLNVARLPAEARRVFGARSAFTLVQLNGVRDWQNRRQHALPDQIRALSPVISQHPQAALTLESCTVWLIVDGELAGGAPIQPSYPDSLPGFEEIEPIGLPEMLPDPETEELVPTGSAEHTSDCLRLRTSRRHLRQTDKALNVIRVRNQRNVVANLSVADLVPQNESAFIFGEVRVSILGAEHLSGSDRKGLADTPLTRAVRHWVSEQVLALAAEVQRAIARDHRPSDRNIANDRLVRFRDLMRQYLERDAIPGDDGMTAPGSGGSGDLGCPPPPPPRRGREVHRIALEPGREMIALASGTAVPLRVHCYEILETGEELPVVGAEFELLSDAAIPLSLSAGWMLRADGTGRSRMRLRDGRSGVESNTIDVEALGCVAVDVEGPERLLLQGEKVRLKATFHTTAGPRDDLLLEGSIDETDMGRISRHGIFSAGRREGEVTVRVRYGAQPADVVTHRLAIGPDALPPRQGGGNDGGGDVPYILLCGTEAPGMQDLPPEQRTHHGGEHHPTIVEEPPFDHIVWINPDSKEATRIRKGRGGRRGPAGIGSKTFAQFVALKCFDILKRLKVRQELGEAAVTEVQFRNHLAVAEMDCADFIDAAFEVADELSNSEVESPA